MFIYLTTPQNSFCPHIMRTSNTTDLGPPPPVPRATRPNLRATQLSTPPIQPAFSAVEASPATPTKKPLRIVIIESSDEESDAEKPTALLKNITPSDLDDLQVLLAGQQLGETSPRRIRTTTAQNLSPVVKPGTSSQCRTAPLVQQRSTQPKYTKPRSMRRDAAEVTPSAPTSVARPSGDSRQHCGDVLRTQPLSTPLPNLVAQQPANVGNSPCTEPSPAPAPNPIAQQPAVPVLRPREYYEIRGVPPPAPIPIPLKSRKFYVVSVGKCTGVFDEW